jgi:hypothetical protein
MLTFWRLFVRCRALGVLHADSSAIDEGGFEGLVTEPVSEAIKVTLLVRGSWESSLQDRGSGLTNDISPS